VSICRILTLSAGAIIIAPTAPGQDCGLWGTVTQWIGTYTLTGQGMALADYGTGSQVTINDRASATVTLKSEGPAVCAAGLGWTSLDLNALKSGSVVGTDQGTGSANDQSGDQTAGACIDKIQGSGALNPSSYSVLGIDVTHSTFMFVPGPFVNTTETFVGDCVPCAPFPGCLRTVWPVYPGANQDLSSPFPKFALPLSPQILTQTASFQGAGMDHAVVTWTLSFRLVPARAWVKVWMTGGTTNQPTENKDIR
jgi:hypothetical protein